MPKVENFLTHNSSDILCRRIIKLSEFINSSGLSLVSFPPATRLENLEEENRGRKVLENFSIVVQVFFCCGFSMLGEHGEDLLGRKVYFPSCAPINLNFPQHNLTLSF